MRRARLLRRPPSRPLWDILVPFADYAFNKAHSAAYGVISYWTAYLKANYPTEYMAALLTSVRDDKDKSALYLGECRHMGITVLPPDVNSSSANFTAVGKDIRFGLTAVRNVGANVVDAIVRTREEKGAFTSFTDFLDKVPAVVCNKRTIESLIKAGAFDSLGHPRRALLLVHEQAVDSVIGVKRKEAEGQFDLFADLMGGDDGAQGFAVVVPDLPDWDKKQRLAFEREMLGLYVSDHPLSGLEHVLAAAADVSIATLLADEQRPDGSTVVIAGLITSLQRKMSKQGNPWAAVTIEDMEASVEIMFFGETYLAYSTALAEDAVVVIRGPRAAARRDHAAAGHGGVAAGRVAGGGRAGRRLDGGLPVHAAGGRAAARGALHAPGRDRGPPAAHQSGPRDRHARSTTACASSGRRPCSGTSRRCSGRAAWRPDQPREHLGRVPRRAGTRGRRPSRRRRRARPS